MNTRLAKDNILGRLKQAKRSPKSAEELAFFPWGSHPDITMDDKAERFVDMMSANHADVRTIQRSELTQVLRDVMDSYGFSRVAIGTAGEYIRDFEDAVHANKLRHSTRR